MTDDAAPFLEILQKQRGGDFLKELAQAVLRRWREYDVKGLVGAGRYVHEGRGILSGD